jgi:hypothetical protein
MHEFGRIAPREREVMSGEKSEKISVVIARKGGRSSIPETSMMESSGRSVLVTPHARGMTGGIDRSAGLRRYLGRTRCR